VESLQLLWSKLYLKHASFADKKWPILNGVSFFYCCFDLSLIMFLLTLLEINDTYLDSPLSLIVFNVDHVGLFHCQDKNWMVLANWTLKSTTPPNHTCLKCNQWSPFKKLIPNIVYMVINANQKKVSILLKQYTS